MNKDKFAGRWHEFKGKVKEKWGKLTDDDITQINGKWDQLSGKLQKRYGWAKEQAERELTDWCTSCEQGKSCCEKEREGSHHRWPPGDHEKKHHGKDDDHKRRKAG